MNLRQLRTLDAFLEKGSFSRAGDAVGLSHSAVSTQMQQLEMELGAVLFDRSSRPPVLTSTGEEIAGRARHVLAQIEDIHAAAAGKTIAGTASLGLVPTTLQSLLPHILNGLRTNYPGLRVAIKSGLSGELSAAVLGRELDFAILTSPLIATPDLAITEIASEPLYVIGPATGTQPASDEALARSMPFISFNKKSWLGQQIAARLQARGIHVDEVMEVDSLDVIETLVADGFGVSIVPQRLLAPPMSDKLVRVPFGDPTEERKLVLIRHAQNRKVEIATTICHLFSRLMHAERN